MPRVLTRLLASLPDVITASIYLAAWIAPLQVGSARVKDLMLTMLIEFLVLHSSGFYAAVLQMDGGRAKRALALAGFSALYSAMIAAFAAIFHSMWPLYAFAWLLASRFWHLLVAPPGSGAERQRMSTLWAQSGSLYVLGAVLTAVLWIPALGVSPAVVASLDLPGKGLWVDKPQTVLAFGALYFGALAAIKLRLTATRA